MEQKKTINILLVEDNPADARLVEIYLQESSLLTPKITRATELKKAMLMLEETDFDLVLLDLTLPDTAGFNTVKTLLDEFPNQTVIVMTGLEDDTIAINSVKAGAQDFIVKGQFDSNLLSRTITYAIERHQLQIKLENYAKAIQINEQRLLEAQKMARMGNWELDIVNNQMYWSDEVYRILGFKENSIEPTLTEYLKYVVSDDVQKLRNAINRTMEKGQPLHIEYKIKLPDQTVKTIANQGQIQMSKKSKGLCLAGTIQDISVFTSGISVDNNAQKIVANLEQILKSAEASGDKKLVGIVNDTISLVKS